MVEQHFQRRNRFGPERYAEWDAQILELLEKRARSQGGEELVEQALRARRDFVEVLLKGQGGHRKQQPDEAKMAKVPGPGLHVSLHS